MFHSTHLNTYAGTINKALDDFTVNLDGFAQSGEQVDMFRQLGRMTMQVIGAAAFGYANFFTQATQHTGLYCCIPLRACLKPGIRCMQTMKLSHLLLHLTLSIHSNTCNEAACVAA